MRSVLGPDGDGRPRGLRSGEAGFALALSPGLKAVHLQSAGEPIRHPSASGAFPEDLLGPVSPIVADANRLGNDILYACRRDQRTTLVTAANAGLFRLFCAQHVIDEVWEKSAEWTQGSPVSRAAFLRCWLTEYLPLIRVVREPLPDDLFTPAEFARIAELARVDPDDVPSAKLALALGAFHLSDDRPALRAVDEAAAQGCGNSRGRVPRPGVPGPRGGIGPVRAGGAPGAEVRGAESDQPPPGRSRPGLPRHPAPFREESPVGRGPRQGASILGSPAGQGEGPLDASIPPLLLRGLAREMASGRGGGRFPGPRLGVYHPFGDVTDELAPPTVFRGAHASPPDRPSRPGPSIVE